MNENEIRQTVSSLSEKVLVLEKQVKKLLNLQVHKSLPQNSKHHTL